MSYVLPSVEVYQQLSGSAGAANTTPDLEVCLIGPVYNVLEYVAGSDTSLINTTALSTLSATGSMTLGSNVITFTTPVPFAIGDVLLIPGASATAGTLSSTVLSVAGYTATMDATAGTTVSAVIVTNTAVISNSTVTNTFGIPGQLPGQVLDPTTIQVYLNNALIETLVTGFTGFSGSTELDISAPTATGTTTAASAVITAFSNATKFVVGDVISVAGAGTAGAALVGQIELISGSTVTLTVPAVTAVTAGVITKPALSNVNSTTSTLLVEAGDEIEIDYVNTSAVAKSVTTTVSQVINLTSTLTSLITQDILPADMSVVTTAATVVVGASVTVASATGIAVGDTIKVAGAGLGGADLITIVGSVTGQVLGGLTPAVTTAVSNAVVTRKANFTVKTRKLYNNQLLPQANPNGGSNYNTSATATSGTIIVEPNPYVVYGRVFSAAVNIAYSALRTDLSGAVQVITTTGDITGILGVVDSNNPAALAASICLANTTTQINVIAVPSDDLIGYETALELAQGANLYALVPLTQETDILELFQVHVDQMSLPTVGQWRIAIVNTAIPTSQNIGPYSVGFVNANGGNNTITVVSGQYVLTASNATFMSDGIVPGDLVVVSASTGTPTQVGSLQVKQILNNQQLVVAATGTATAVSYFVNRTLTKAQKATAVAAASTTFGDKRVVHVQPDTVGITVGGVIEYLPGYYLCAALGGMVAGFPVQQGFTNIGVAGVSDLKNSNFYFTRAQMDQMASVGTFLFVQATQGSIPYVRHELTTDVSVLQYRELLCVKNWDWLSYAYSAVLAPFIGRWNITTDTLNTIRQTIVSASNQYISQKLPKIGAPLLGYTINSLIQDATSKDQVDVNMTIEIVYPLNYLALYLVI
jgi:hypothetical protein